MKNKAERDKRTLGKSKAPLEKWIKTAMIIWLEKKRFKQEPESILLWKSETLPLVYL